MRWIVRMLVILVAVTAILAAVAFLLPREVKVARATSIAAAPEAIFPLIADFNRFNDWSPWYERDPGMSQTIEGEPGSVGHAMVWISQQSDVGAGRNEIIEIDPNRFLRTKLIFEGQGPGEAHFTLEPAGGATEVTWVFETDLGMNPVLRWFGLMFDGLIGADYEAGLAKLKALAEAG